MKTKRVSLYSSATTYDTIPLDDMIATLLELRQRCIERGLVNPVVVACAGYEDGWLEVNAEKPRP